MTSIQINGADKGVLHGGDQDLPLTLDGVDLAGGVLVHRRQSSQQGAGIAVIDLQPQQFIVKILSLRENDVGPAEEQVFIFIGQGGVHIVHAGELQQHQLLVDVIRRGGDGLTVDIKGFAAGQQPGGDPAGLHPHLAPDAVGIDDAAYPDKFLLHKALLVCV